MKAGDLIRVKDWAENRDQESLIWNEFMGKVGVIIAMAKRRHFPAAKVLVKGEVADFDFDELEAIHEVW